MTVLEAPARPDAPAAPPTVGPVGRLGRFAADHLRLVVVAWAVVAAALAVFAPSVETALSGAGWEANGSESVRARTLVEDG
ncbi:MAG: MMPL family transporter, partial [Pseudomonadota bacterium]